ncbi:MAG: methylated-DNA--[protein]-cysteine S-methyltransferase [Filomicrobium sp.]
MAELVELAQQPGDPHSAVCDEADYAFVRRAIAYLRQADRDASGLDDLARHLGVSTFHCQRLFKRWCGLSPKEFTSAIALDRARRLLLDSESVLGTAHAVGMSGGGRLHDLFVTHEAMTPGEFKKRGVGLQMAYGVHATPFGTAVAVATTRGLAGLAFVDDDKGQNANDARDDLLRRWPGAELVEAPERTQPILDVVFDPARWSHEDPVRLVMIGTEWEVRVWQALLKIPMGGVVSYRQIAEQVCTHKAARAVGTAVGKNPLSFIVPCHRVVRSDGGLGGYHWGLNRKLALIGWEAGQIGDREG